MGFFFITCHLHFHGTNFSRHKIFYAYKQSLSYANLRYVCIGWRRSHSMSYVFRENNYRIIFFRIHLNGIKIKIFLKFVHYLFLNKSLVSRENAWVMLLYPNPDPILPSQLFGWLGSLSLDDSEAARLFSVINPMLCIEVMKYAFMPTWHNPRVIWQEGISIRNMPSPYWPVDKLWCIFLVSDWRRRTHMTGGTTPGQVFLDQGVEHKKAGWTSLGEQPGN